jgi:hypothetical protein
MAIEAVKQLVQMRHPQKEPIAKFVLRDISMYKPIILDQSDGSSSSEVEI